MGKTYKEAHKGSKQELEAFAYRSKRQVKHKHMEPYKRTK